MPHDESRMVLEVGFRVFQTHDCAAHLWQIFDQVRKQNEYVLPDGIEKIQPQ